MRPVHFDQANAVFGPPDKWGEFSDSICGQLSVMKCQEEGLPGSMVMVSCWEFSKEDLDIIKTTGKMYVMVWGHGLPPIALEPDFEKVTGGFDTDDASFDDAPNG